MKRSLYTSSLWPDGGVGVDVTQQLWQYAAVPELDKSVPPSQLPTILIAVNIFPRTAMIAQRVFTALCYSTIQSYLPALYSPELSAADKEKVPRRSEAKIFQEFVLQIFK